MEEVLTTLNSQIQFASSCLQSFCTCFLQVKKSKLTFKGKYVQYTIQAKFFIIKSNSLLFLDESIVSEVAKTHENFARLEELLLVTSTILSKSMESFNKAQKEKLL